MAPNVQKLAMIGLLTISNMSLHALNFAQSSLAGLQAKSFYLQHRFFQVAPAVLSYFEITDPIEKAVKRLLTDFDYYLTTNVHVHAGDLYQHSIWVANSVARFWYDPDFTFWTHGLDEQRDKQLSILAALIHDIGKAGDIQPGTKSNDGVVYENGQIKRIAPAGGFWSDGPIKHILFHDKPEHPYAGFQYLTGNVKRHKDYLLVNQFKLSGSPETFNFKREILEKLSEEDRRLMLVVVGMHWKFGGMILSTFSDSGKKIGVDKVFEDRLLEEYLTQLRCYARSAGYNKVVDSTGEKVKVISEGSIDDRLIRMAVLISAADNLGQMPVDISQNYFGLATPSVPKNNQYVQHEGHTIAGCAYPIPAKREAECKAQIFYFKYKYNDQGAYFRKRLLEYFDKHQARLMQPIGTCKIDEKN